MSYSDWIFTGEDTAPIASYRCLHIAYKYGGANGAPPADLDNGGCAIIGGGKLNSDLSDPLSQSAEIGGATCRGMEFGLDTDTNASYRTWAGMSLLTSSAAGPLYPTTKTPAEGQFHSYSLRAFLRVENDAGNSPTDLRNIRSYIGLTAKAKANDSPPGLNLTTSYSPSPPANTFSAYGTNTGYNILLSSGKHCGHDSITTQPDGTNTGAGTATGESTTGLRLLFQACPVNDLDNNDSANYVYLNCAGTYDFNNWHHVRMDVIPTIGADIINVYTASIDEDVGSENWGLVGETTVPAASLSYRNWDPSVYSPNYDGGNQSCGWVCGSASEASAASAVPQSVFIDRFQFFTKDVSGSVPT